MSRGSRVLVAPRHLQLCALLAGCVACAPLPEASSAEIRAVPLVDPRGAKLPNRIGALDVVGAYDLRSRQT